MNAELGSTIKEQLANPENYGEKRTAGLTGEQFCAMLKRWSRQAERRTAF